ncbi:MAG: hypothetical protein B7X42_05535 [Thiomonas sp. 14-66-4]|nr:MAG: hypothetical protein B7X42_05535 [Thiomonas sp. 14-66-4]
MSTMLHSRVSSSPLACTNSARKSALRSFSALSSCDRRLATLTMPLPAEPVTGGHPLMVVGFQRFPCELF